MIFTQTWAGFAQNFDHELTHVNRPHSDERWGPVDADQVTRSRSRCSTVFLRRRAGPTERLRMAISCLGWDQRFVMPGRGARPHPLLLRVIWGLFALAFTGWQSAALPGICSDLPALLQRYRGGVPKVGCETVAFQEINAGAVASCRRGTDQHCS